MWFYKLDQLAPVEIRAAFLDSHSWKTLFASGNLEVTILRVLILALLADWKKKNAKISTRKKLLLACELAMFTSAHTHIRAK